MKVGDLVRYTGCTLISKFGVVTAIGYAARYKSTDETSALHPDIHVLTEKGLTLWNHKFVEVISESR